MPPDEKDLQIALLRQQLSALQRKARTKPRLSRPKKRMLVALTTRLKAQSQRFQKRLREAILLVQPETVIKWHRELVRRKWTFQQPNRGGRPQLEAGIEALIIRIARENPRIGYDNIQGELLNLGFTLDPTTVQNVLRRHPILPAPQRGKSSWRTFLKHYRQQMLACAFFTVETLHLQTLYVLFFISEGMEIVRTPFRAPTANAIAERWVRSVRHECLDYLLILNQRHLIRVLKEYTTYYNGARPQQGINQQTPIPFSRPQHGTLDCRDVLGGILHHYYRDAA